MYGIHQLAERLNENFMLFVMGSGKNGKSTLINALLGQQAAAEDFLPKTWKIDVFHDADLDASCTLTFKDGSCRSMTAGEAQAYIEGEEQKRKDSERAIRQELREFKKKKVPSKYWKKSSGNCASTACTSRRSSKRPGRSATVIS